MKAQFENWVFIPDRWAHGPKRKNRNMIFSSTLATLKIVAANKVIP